MVAALAFGTGLGTACRAPSPTAPSALASITVTPNATLLINGTQQFVAVGKDAGGGTLVIVPVWTVVLGGGTISGGGLFTAGTAPGVFTATIQASAGGKSGTASVTVTVGDLVSMTVTPDSMGVSIGGTQQFTAVAKDAGGNLVPVSPTWSVVAGGGTIDGTGLFSAGTTAGNFPNTISAVSSGISGFATVDVTAGPLVTMTVSPDPATLSINGTQQFFAVGRDDGGNVVATVPIWSVVAGGGAINSTGLFTAGAMPGHFASTVRVASGGVSGLATVDVVAGALATITLSPNPVTLSIDDTQQFTAVGRDVAGNIVGISPVWSIVAGGGAINASGLFTAGTTAGTFASTIKAVSGSGSGFATVSVTPGPLATITVSPNPTTLPINGIRQLTAVGTDAHGNVVPISPVWSVSGCAGTITNAGLFTAHSWAGNFLNTIRAISGGVTGFATVSVVAGPLATITVSPDPTTLAIHGTQQFTAAGSDAGGNAVAITPVWSVVAGGGAISPAGLFTAGTTANTFANTIRAVSGSVSSFATVTVTAGALATVTVSPNPSTVPTDATQQFTAVGSDASGNPVAISPTWDAINGGGVISATGLFTAGTTVGTFASTVRASDGISGLATVEVVAALPASILVSPNPTSVPYAGTRQFTATATDASGNPVAISPVWSVAGGGGSITAGGLFTAFTNTGVFIVRATSNGVFGISSVQVNPPLVDMEGIETFAAFGNTTVTCGDLTTIAGDVGVAPGTSITGFPPCTLTGVQHPNDAYAVFSRTRLVNAFTQLQALSCDFPFAGDLGGQTLPPGVHCNGASIAITGEVSLDADGDPNAVFVLQAGTTLLPAAGAVVTLLNGAQAKNVYWVVGSSATIAANSFMKGNVFVHTTVTTGVGVTIVGRLLAVNAAVTLGTSNVIGLP
jgi:hypothetical protein